jgi:hypothetical protein
MLHAVGKGWRFQVDSRSEFVAKVTVAVRLVFAGFSSITKQAHPKK